MRSATQLRKSAIAPIPARGNVLGMTDSRHGRKWLIYLGWVVLCVLVFWKPVLALFHLAEQDETASHIILVPFIAAWLIYTERKQLQVRDSLEFRAALLFSLPALLLTLLVLQCATCTPKETLSGFIFALVLLLVAGFIAILGKDAAKSSWFAFAILLFAVPLPESLLNKTIYWLQSGSAAVAELLFDLSGVPVLRQGFYFYLPEVSIEVAQECSGIRSSIALLILALLVAHFAFRPFWKKTVFVLAGLAMMLIKNGVRIATLTLLANYVNRSFLYGKLHHQGGVVFFIIGLALLLPVYWLLRRGETSVEPAEHATVCP
jgi:exosortase